MLLSTTGAKVPLGEHITFIQSPCVRAILHAASFKGGVSDRLLISAWYIKNGAWKGRVAEWLKATDCKERFLNFCNITTGGLAAFDIF